MTYEYDDHESWEDFSERVTFEYYLPGALALGSTAIANALLAGNNTLVEIGGTIGTGAIVFTGLSYLARKIDITDIRSE